MFISNANNINSNITNNTNTNCMVLHPSNDESIVTKKRLLTTQTDVND